MRYRLRDDFHHTEWFGGELAARPPGQSRDQTGGGLSEAGAAGDSAREGGGEGGGWDRVDARGGLQLCSLRFGRYLSLVAFAWQIVCGRELQGGAGQDLQRRHQQPGGAQLHQVAHQGPPLLLQGPGAGLRDVPEEEAQYEARGARTVRVREALQASEGSTGPGTSPPSDRATCASLLTTWRWGTRGLT